MMGGRIDVESRAGRGSTFRVVLPLASADAPAKATRAPRSRAGSGAARGAAPPIASATPPRILAAEDNPTNQLVLSTVMQVFGVELELVSDGREAVEAWERGAFDLILMDIQMPNMDGIEATRAIRESESRSGRARTPIVALSANAMTHQVRDYLAAGMDAHVAKPIELPRLQAVLEAALEGREAAAA